MLQQKLGARAGKLLTSGKPITSISDERKYASELGYLVLQPGDKAGLEQGLASFIICALLICPVTSFMHCQWNWAIW